MGAIVTMDQPIEDFCGYSRETIEYLSRPLGVIWGEVRQDELLAATAIHSTIHLRTRIVRSSLDTGNFVATLLLDLQKMVLCEGFLPRGAQFRRKRRTLPFEILAFRSSTHVNGPVEDNTIPEFQ